MCSRCFEDPNNTITEEDFFEEVKTVNATSTRCSCGMEDGLAPHPCPTAVVEYGDETPCNCCASCQDECVNNIS